jgi:hypothetical protein
MGKVKIIFFALMFTLLFSVTAFANTKYDQKPTSIYRDYLWTQSSQYKTQTFITCDEIKIDINPYFPSDPKRYWGKGNIIQYTRIMSSDMGLPTFGDWTSSSSFYSDWNSLGSTDPFYVGDPYVLINRVVGSVSEGTLPSAVTNDFSVGVFFLTPSEDNLPSTSNPQSYSFRYILPKNNSLSAKDIIINIKQNGFADNIKVLKNDCFSTTLNSESVYIGVCEFTAPMNTGSNVTSVMVESIGNPLYSATRSTTYARNLEDLVVPTPPDRSDYAIGLLGDVGFGFATVIWYLTYPLRIMSDVFSTLIDTFNSFSNSFHNVQGFLTSLFSFLPPPVNGLIIIGFSFLLIGVFLRTFGRK